MKLKKYLSILIFIIFSLSLLSLSFMLYIKYLWPNADYEQLKNTLLDLTPDVLRNSTYFSDYLCGMLFFIVVWPIAGIKLNEKQQFCGTILCLFAIFFLSGMAKYIYVNQAPSTLYEEEYVTPSQEEISLPEQPRNLILIFLESFEQNYSQSRYYEKNLIPHLTALQTEDNHIKNHQTLSGTNYSIAALVSAHCGIPLRYRKEREIWENQYFLPQVTCFPEILQQKGYQTKIIKAADINFTQAGLFALSHGYKEALGVNELKEKYPELKEEKYHGAFGGINDRTLFDYAKKELAEFSPDAPFMLTLFSLDTHTPDYHKDKQCTQQFGDLRDAYICTDSIVNDFISWLKKSPYYENTTVVIIGDHLLPVRIKTIGHPERSIYNVFLNLPQDMHLDTNRHFSSLDIPATILESLNIKLNNHKFGLGRSLLSNEKTLAEKMPEELNIKSMQPSQIYDRFTTPLTEHQIAYHPYKLGTILKGKDILTYTDAYEEIIGSHYLNNLGFDLVTTPANDITVNIEFKAIIDRKIPITFYANHKEVFKFTPKKNETQPYKVSFTIPRSWLKDNQLLITFRNHKGLVTATEMGIVPLTIQLKEK